MAKAAIIMGSDSDWPIMKNAVSTLQSFGIDTNVLIMSAHRTPEQAGQFAKQAKEEGYGVLIAGAGMAAHLAGALAAHTILPVIGVPLISGEMAGLDALLSTVQMPPGIPVATVGVNGAKNAAILAVQILAQGEPSLWLKLTEHKANMQRQITEKQEKLNGWVKDLATEQGQGR